MTSNRSFDAETQRAGQLGRKERVVTPLSIWDRFVYGALSAAFGAFIGAAATVMIAFGLHAHSGAWSIVGFSALFFFAVGWCRGADGGFFVGEALAVLGAVGVAEIGAMPTDVANADKPAQWSSVWLLLAWLLGVGVFAWRALR